MRKRDKLKNIEQANLMLEQSYLKSKGLLIEGKRVKLSDNLLGQIDQIIDKTIPKEIHKMGYVTGSQNTPLFVGYLKYSELGSDVQSVCKTYIIVDDPSKPIVYDGGSDSFEYEAFYNGGDKKNPSDNFIMINLFYLKRFGSISPKNLLDTYLNKGKEHYRDVLVHEITHAVDPKNNSRHVLDTTYDPNTKQNGEEYIKNYLTHDKEVIAQSTAFFNRLIRTATQIKKENNNPEIIKLLNKNLDLLLEAFSTGNYKILYNNEFMSLMEGAIPKKLITFLEKIVGKIEKVFLGSPNITMETVGYINQDKYLHDLVFKGDRNDFFGNITRILFYKKYNPKAWKAFLTKLYNTVQEAKEIINS